MQSFIISNSLCAEQSSTSLEKKIKIIVYNETAQAAKLLNTRQQSAAALERHLATCSTGCGLLSNWLANAYFVLAFN